MTREISYSSEYMFKSFYACTIMPGAFFGTCTTLLGINVGDSLAHSAQVGAFVAVTTGSFCGAAGFVYGAGMDGLDMIGLLPDDNQ